MEFLGHGRGPGCHSAVASLCSALLQQTEFWKRGQNSEEEPMEGGACRHSGTGGGRAGFGDKISTNNSRRLRTDGRPDSSHESHAEADASAGAILAADRGGAARDGARAVAP